MPIGFAKHILASSAEEATSFADATVIWSTSSSTDTLVPLQSVNGTQPASAGISNLAGNTITAADGPLIKLAPGDYTITFNWAAMYGTGTNPGVANLILYYAQKSGDNHANQQGFYSKSDGTSDPNATYVAQGSTWGYTFESNQGDTALQFTHTQTNANNNYGLLAKLDPASFGASGASRRVSITVSRTA